MPLSRRNKPSTDSVLTIILALRDSLVRSNQSYLVSQMKERLNTISDSIISKGTAISKSLNGSLSSPSCSRIKWNPSTLNLMVTSQSTGMMLKPQVQQPKNVKIEWSVINDQNELMALMDLPSKLTRRSCFTLLKCISILFLFRLNLLSPSFVN